MEAEAVVVPTFWARGAGGAVYEFDELKPGTNRAEIMSGQIAKGELVLLASEDGLELSRAEIDAFLAAAAAPPPNIRTRAGRAPGGDTAADNEPGAEPVAMSDDGVPDGTIDFVLDWVTGGGDEPADGWQGRAQAALDHERAKASPRVSLVAKLEDALAGAEPVAMSDDGTSTIDNA